MTGKPKNFTQAIDELEREQATSSSGGLAERLQDELRKMEETLNKIKPHVEDFASNAATEAKTAKQKVEAHVQSNPWAAIGIAGLLFFVLGFLFGYKGSRRND